MPEDKDLNAGGKPAESGGKPEGSLESSFKDWIGQQPEETRALIEEWETGLKKALRAERDARSTLEKQVAELTPFRDLATNLKQSNTLQGEQMLQLQNSFQTSQEAVKKAEETIAEMNARLAQEQINRAIEREVLLMSPGFLDEAVDLVTRLVAEKADQFKVDDKGVQGVKEAVAAVAKERPFLLKKKPAPDLDGGASGQRSGKSKEEYEKQLRQRYGF